MRGEADRKERQHRHRSRSPRGRQEREGGREKGREAEGEEEGQENHQRTDRFRSERFDGPGGADGENKGFPKPTHFWGVSLIVLNFRYDQKY